MKKKMEVCQMLEILELKKQMHSISGRYPGIILFTDRMRKQHGR